MDITEQHEAKNELAYLATPGTLTGLHNRRGVVALLEERLTDAPADRGTLLLIDIDHFKDVNDTRGTWLPGRHGRLRQRSRIAAVAAPHAVRGGQAVGP